MTICHGVIADALPALSPLLTEILTRCGSTLYRKLGSNPTALTRVEQFYIPVFAYLEQQLSVLSKRQHAPYIIGISAPQGCGKTTLTESLREAFELTGKSCVSLSLDDFYLTGNDQESLSEEFSENEILQCRGNGRSLQHTIS